MIDLFAFLSKEPHWLITIIIGGALGAASREIFPRLYNIVFSKVQQDPILRRVVLRTFDVPTERRTLC